MNEIYQTLLSTLLTPIAFGLAVFTAWLLRDQIRAIIIAAGITHAEVSKEGVKVDIDIEKLTKDLYSKQGMGKPSSEDVQEVTTLIKTFSPYVAGRRILWVDNEPSNNHLEREILTSWGADVQTKRTTDEALTELRNKKETSYDLVISDWFRKGKPEGKRLAEAMHSTEEKLETPILFYFFAGDPNLFKSIKGEAQSLQAIGATSSPRELLRWTFAELVRAFLRDTKTNLAL
jgi:hypothetical protein